MRVLPRTSTAGSHAKVKVDTCAVAGGARCANNLPGGHALPSLHIARVAIALAALM